MTDCDTLEGRRRVVIEAVEPAVDGGQFSIKRTVGDVVVVSADVFADGHDVVRCELLCRRDDTTEWRRTPMSAQGNDRWQASFRLDEVGQYYFTIEGWVDHFETWRRDLQKRIDADQDIRVDLQIGARLVGEASERAPASEAVALREWQTRLQQFPGRGHGITATLLDELTTVVEARPDRRFSTVFAPQLGVVSDRERARFSAWYELFPRSTSSQPGEHGTLRDVQKRLESLAAMGFDVVYLPPIHPIGQTFRKGKNNAERAAEGEVGSPWAIGSKDGGHTAVHPQLGTLEDLRALIDSAHRLGMEIALDIAFQCSPDHPYVQQHPEWFRSRPDGTIQYAENPPKKYQDIYPFDFESLDWRGLWQELTDVVLFWCRQGVRVFRVDNPHTKSFAFWEYLIGRVKREFPDAIFLSEAFTRPKIMYRLAKLGFSQSYTYFTWRNHKPEFVEYFTELTQSKVHEFFRPNLWPNTPDILPDHLQTGGRTAFISRLVLAATLSSNYGIYGPVYELGEATPREPGSEEYLDSEKYEIRAWDLNHADSIAGIITTINRARRENQALQSNESLRFHPTDNEQLVCYSKRDVATDNLIVMVVNLDFHGEQHGFIELPLEELGLAVGQPYRLHDILNETTFEWLGGRNYVELDPHRVVAHVFRVEQGG